MIGRVTSCKRDKGYCFIREHDTGNSYFCHFSKTDDGTLDSGYLVEFKVGYDFKNDRAYAKEVKVIDSWYRS